jgi:hypothetical protein
MSQRGRTIRRMPSDLPYGVRLDRALLAFLPYEGAVLTPTDVSALDLDLLHREGLIKPDTRTACVWRTTARGHGELARVLAAAS